MTVHDRQGQKATPAQRRGLDAIKSGLVQFGYTGTGGVRILIYSGGPRIDVLDRLRDAGWAEVSRDRRPYARSSSSVIKEIADVVLTQAGRDQVR